MGSQAEAFHSVSSRVRSPANLQLALVRTSQLEVLNAGRVLGAVCRRLGAARPVGELGEAVRVGAGVHQVVAGAQAHVLPVGLGHQQHRVQVERLARAGHRLRVAQEAVVHLACQTENAGVEAEQGRARTWLLAEAVA